MKIVHPLGIREKKERKKDRDCDRILERNFFLKWWEKIELSRKRRRRKDCDVSLPLGFDLIDRDRRHIDHPTLEKEEAQDPDS